MTTRGPRYWSPHTPPRCWRPPAGCSSRCPKAWSMRRRSELSGGSQRPANSSCIAAGCGRWGRRRLPRAGCAVWWLTTATNKAFKQECMCAVLRARCVHVRVMVRSQITEWAQAERRAGGGLARELSGQPEGRNPCNFPSALILSMVTSMPQTGRSSKGPARLMHPLASGPGERRRRTVSSAAQPQQASAGQATPGI